MKVKNMESTKGNTVPNQFIIEAIPVSIGGSLLLDCDVFQSYNSIIAVRDLTGRVYLDPVYWDYSVTTGKYRNQFLGENKAETQKKIDSGEYVIVDLN